ncbi:FemAB-related protein, PEP-CTERM system-associated [Halogranum rubrum]|uniref:FemAB-related protein, PEP-CTERM system-associated n=1 Tax=Halogranum rubrum TaxID=553466 RepID=A0A1I4ITF6_9EURY|nr:GNAT family N-acetyltransferase [Halogranum rubrum]SFL57046.1 FemAB-related protein, PEP-CTERM system-associated [Halogranum rubrum]
MSTYSTHQLNVEPCTDAAEWDAFVEENDGSPYSLWGWGTAVETYGHDRFYLVARAGETIVGALPLIHMESRLFGSQLVSPPFGERGSLVLRNDHSETAEAATAVLLERTKQLADDLGVDFVSLRGAAIEPQQEFTEKRRFVTFSVPVDGSSESVWDGVKSSRQRQIRQAEDARLEYRVGDSLSDLKQYHKLYLKSMRDHGSPPHSFEFHRVLWENLAPEGHLHLGMVELDGTLINGIIDLSLGSTVYQWGVITDYEYRDLQGGSFALWKSIERANESGFDAYEMGRTREGSGVYMFKKSFGGTKVWYDDLHYFPSDSAELPDPEKESYEPLKRVWRRLPIPVTQTIGPAVRKDISL